MSTTEAQTPDNGELAIGMRVLIQTGYGEWHEGNIESIVDMSGEITVRDDDGHLWIGVEDHVERVVEETPA